MDDLKSWYREQLTGRIKALESARATLVGHEPGALASVRRVAHTLRGSGATYGFPEVTEAAQAVEEAQEERVAACLERLLVILRDVVAGGDAPRMNILVVDDDPAIGRILKQKLASDARKILVAYSGASAQEIVAKTAVHLIVLDLILPDTDGRNLLVRFREQPETAMVPIVVMTALSGGRSRTECEALGADEYVEKPVDADKLASMVSTRLQRAGAALQQSNRDPLTGLPNRAAFREAFDRAQAQARRTHAPLALAILDMDHFKSINDTYGHLAGDETLRRSASLIPKCLRQTDVVARLGGEEFVALFPESDRKGAKAALEKALDALRQEVFKAADGREFHAQFSAGVADVRPGAAFQDALEEADRLLYQAKAGGRSRVLDEGIKSSSPVKKILIAEDDPLVVSVVKQRLGREGFDVVHAPDGTSALAASEDPAIELFLLDVQMPNMNGFELLECLRKKPALTRTPMVMLTALGNEDDVVRGLDLGADDYVTKPFSPVELVARVRRLLNKK